MNSNHFYTITPINTPESSWQPDANINNKIRDDIGITSNWKYRQYVQTNAKHIMKYNTMEYIYASGNNPYAITNNSSNLNVPFMFSSIYDQNEAENGFNNSDLKKSFLKTQQVKGRMIAPSISTQSFS